MTFTRNTTARIRSLAIVLIASCALSLACSTKAKLFATWKEPNTSAGPFQKVAAIALTANEETRKIAEDEFVRRLGKNTAGVSSYSILTEADEADVEKVVAKLRTADVDAVAVMRLIEEENSVVYDPGSFYRPSYSFNSFYGGVYSAYHDPGYLTTEVAVRVETALYSIGGAKEELVWTGYSESLNPKSAQTVIDDVTRLVVRELQLEKILR